MSYLAKTPYTKCWYNLQQVDLVMHLSILCPTTPLLDRWWENIEGRGHQYSREFVAMFSVYCIVKAYVSNHQYFPTVSRELDYMICPAIRAIHVLIGQIPAFILIGFLIDRHIPWKSIIVLLLVTSANVIYCTNMSDLYLHKDHLTQNRYTSWTLLFV